MSVTLERRAGDAAPRRRRRLARLRGEGDAGGRAGLC